MASVLSDSLQQRLHCKASQWTEAREILQARILAWVAMPSFRGSFRPRDRTKPCALWPTRGVLFVLHWVFACSPCLCVLCFTLQTSTLALPQWWEEGLKFHVEKWVAFFWSFEWHLLLAVKQMDKPKTIQQIPWNVFFGRSFTSTVAASQLSSNLIILCLVF